MNKDFKDFTIVIHVIKSEPLTDNQKNFLALLFQLKTNDHFNINRLLIDLSFQTKVKCSFGNKPHQLLIYYESPIKLSSLKTDFIQILDSQDDKEEFERLSHDDSFFIIGNSRISKLEIKQAKKINKLITCYNSQIAAPLNPQKSNTSPCRHYKTFNNNSNT